MTEVRLPKTIDPIRMAKEKICYVGEVSLDKMHRLADVVLSPQAKLKVSLQGQHDELDFPVISGQMAVKLTVECQRCLKPVDILIKAAFLWSPVASDEAARELPDTHEPILYEGKPLNLVELLEDELLLNLPIVNYHADSACDIPAAYKATEAEVQSTPKENLTHKPFAGLEYLKDDLKKPK